MREEEKQISMITKSFEVLELLSKNPYGLTLQEIVTQLQYPKSSLYKIVSNLQELGYLGREMDSSRYFLSRKLLTLGVTAFNSSNIIERSKEYMKLLRDEVGESVMIGTLIDDEVVLLEQITGSLDFVFTLKQGMKFNLYSTAPGKVILAFLDKSKQNEIVDNLQLEAINEYTITDKTLLKQELEIIRQQGYAADINETVEGVHCIAAPIWDETKNAIACVWTSGPAGRLPKKSIETIAQQIIECGLLISHNIGYRKV
ncbi:IclR family transcriptional regulator [Dysgonomonas sp. GY617]|uniref:IclR family transcriptional regulator n=1 Tax=Dysgonomonas sp. GY617 TaxID=2780420 RepID=UPI00188484EB|nr:IclR family transcriptional regulator [Dysgonomonas sp. GY617]MBF0575475.1 IclR family transcriptional regulator [Dysgonomonas sp. GY617]